MKDRDKERDKFNRREFLVKTSAVGAGSLVLPSLSAAKTEIDFLRSSCGDAKTDAPHVLVAYASRCGTTGQAADAIAKQFCASGARADTHLIKEVSDLSGYNAVVLGSAARNGKWLPEASAFVKKNAEALGTVPVAYFMTCLQVVPEQPALDYGGPPPKDETVEQARERVRKYLDPVIKKNPGVKPVDVGVFAGAIDFSVLKRSEKALMKSAGFVGGDWRNFERIASWAKGIAPAMLNK